MIALLAIGAALGAEPPGRPSLAEPHGTQCLETLGIDEGQMIPDAIRDGLTGRCSFIAVPLSDYADLLALSAWADHVATRYEIDTGELQYQVDWYRSEIARLNEPVPYLQRPSTHYATGLASGAAILLASAWAFSQVTK